ncbi:agglutinin ssa [Pyrenophora seminiperda CCB06]|uniref:Agglutinin ssa n=1 Tax=Pyrenophora seminiperda CCB06 TaxID=1302712 RepID=A0A3M7M794_9PLEO|nr:agglutinin ssa [Pyrenophora seminiperda CCB06]
MSDYTGPGLYEILPIYAQTMSLNVWGNEKTAGTAVKLYNRTADAKNTHWEIVAAGGVNAKPESGDREYHIIAANSGLYLAMNTRENSGVTVELRAPLDPTIRWKLAYCRNGAFCINNVNNQKQLNVNGGAKAVGTEIISYDMSPTSENTQFVLKAV